MYRYHTVLTKFSIHISPWWTWSHFTQLYFWEALKPREGSPTTLSLGNWSCGLLYVAKTSNQTAIFAVLDATNCQDLSVQWDLPNTERISVGFHGTGNLKKGNAKKLCFCMLKTCEKMTRRKHLVEIPVFVGCFRRLVVMTSPVIAKSVGIGISIAKESNAVVMVTPALAVKKIIQK